MYVDLLYKGNRDEADEGVINQKIDEALARFDDGDEIMNILEFSKEKMYQYRLDHPLPFDTNVYWEMMTGDERAPSIDRDVLYAKIKELLESHPDSWDQDFMDAGMMYTEDWFKNVAAEHKVMTLQEYHGSLWTMKENEMLLENIYNRFFQYATRLRTWDVKGEESSKARIERDLNEKGYAFVQRMGYDFSPIPYEFEEEIPSLPRYQKIDASIWAKYAE
jgi:hypothetical protein